MGNTVFFFLDMRPTAPISIASSIVTAIIDMLVFAPAPFVSNPVVYVGHGSTIQSAFRGVYLRNRNLAFGKYPPDNATNNILKRCKVFLFFFYGVAFGISN